MSTRRRKHRPRHEAAPSKESPIYHDRDDDDLGGEDLSVGEDEPEETEGSEHDNDIHHRIVHTNKGTADN